MIEVRFEFRLFEYRQVPDLVLVTVIDSANGRSMQPEEAATLLKADKDPQLVQIGIEVSNILSSLERTRALLLREAERDFYWEMQNAGNQTPAEDMTFDERLITEAFGRQTPDPLFILKGEAAAA